MNIMEPWDHILETLNYTGNGNIIVTADVIKKCSKSWKGSANQFEPRLLCYQTTANARPSAFKRHNIYILPIKNGTYLLTKDNTYMPLEYISGEPTRITKDASSVMLTVGESETSLIDNMRYSGVFETGDILGEKITHGPLINGRHRISMEMKLGGHSIDISGVQYETDSCFESANKILIIEGKSSTKTLDSFNIRQLYFPFREAVRMASGKKEVICVFIHKLDTVIHVWKYTFSDLYSMDSIVLTGHYTYVFNS